MRRLFAGRAALALITAAGAVLRFATLGMQSFSGDEGVTVRLLEMDLGGMLDTIPESESTPPLYYLLAWLWTQVAGTSELGVRSLSALLGTAAIPLVYAAAADLVSRRAALVAAALTAASPLLVWYSQEARAYSLLVLLATASLLFFAQALNRRGERALWWWALSAALALGTHYYAAFLVVPEAAWLVAALPPERRRSVLAPAGAVLVAGLLLLPLALDQRSTGNFAAFIEDIPLGDRVKEVPKKFLLGEQGTPGDYGGFAETLLPLAALLALAGALLLVLRAQGRERRGGLVAAALGALAAGVPVAMALAGFDYFAAYLVIGAFVPLAVAAGAGFASGRAGLATGAALVLVFAALSAYATSADTLQRPDFEAAAAALGEPSGPRAVVSNPDNSPAPLSVYGRDLEPFPAAGAAVREVAVLGMAAEDESTRQRSGADPRRPPARGFRLVRERVDDELTLLVFRADRPLRVSAEQLAASRLGEGSAAVSLER